MAKSSERYWREREAAQRRKDITDQTAYNREVRRIYQQMQDNIQKEIDAFYGKYAQKEGITLAEAKRRVSAIDFEAYERKAKRYVKAASRDRKEGTKERAGYYFSDQANAEMRLYNLTMKVNRLELLKANIGLELVDGFDRLNETFDEKLTRHATNEFTRLAGILGDSVRNNPQYVHAIVNASFHNATYSDRIWTHQDTLKAALDRQIQIGLIQGKSSTELARAIRQEFGVSRKNAERLMLTEMRRARTEVARISYEENGTKEYQFLALGGNPCDTCADIDGKVFPVKDMMPGANAPPMHPNCLCCTAPYWDEEKFQRWLDSGAAADGVPWAEFEAEQNPVARPVDSGIIGANIKREDPDVQKLCELQMSKLKEKYPELQSSSVVLTEERKRHILERHPGDVSVFQTYATTTIEDPDVILNDSKNDETVMYIRAIEKSNLNVIVKLAVSTTEDKQHSVMTSYRLGRKTLKRLMKKNEVLYKRE